MEVPLSTKIQIILINQPYFSLNTEVKKISYGVMLYVTWLDFSLKLFHDVYDTHSIYFWFWISITFFSYSVYTFEQLIFSFCFLPINWCLFISNYTCGFGSFQESPIHKFLFWVGVSVLQCDQLTLYASGLALLEQNLHTLDSQGIFDDKVTPSSTKQIIFNK